MKTALILTLLLSSFIALHQCGHIYSQATDIRPQNAGEADTFHLFFMLETAVISGDALFIKFPILVGSPSVSISSSLDVTVTPTITTTSHYLNDDSSASDKRYFVLGSALSANTWYRAVVTISDATNEKALVQGCIWVATTSTYLTNFITYDENRCFDVISFAPAIDKTGSLYTVTGYYLYTAKDTYKTIAGSYNVNFDIAPSQVTDSTNGAVFKIKMGSTSSFTFTGTCSSIACTVNDGTAGDYCAANITALSSSAYTCAVSSTTLTITRTSLTNQNTFRIQATVQAPSDYIGSHVDLTSTFESNKASIIFASSTVTVGSQQGINLVTDLTSYSVQGTNLLLWGVTPSSTVTKKATSYVGCPVALYASNTINIYNSLTTSFTLTKSSSAYKLQNYIQAVWTLISAGTISDIIVSSLYTTLPGTPTFTISSNDVLIAGITDLSATTYKIGAKFSIDATASVAAISTVTGNGITVGVVQLRMTTTTSKVYVNVGGTTVGLKKNYEYIDSSLPTLGGVNQVYSYWSSQSAYDFSTSTATIATTAANYFWGASSSYSSGAGVWPKGSGTGTQSVLLQINFDLTATTAPGICTATADAYWTGTTLTASTDICNVQTISTDGTYILTFTPQIAVLLKVVFNNGVLGIAETNFPRGVKVLLTLFSGATVSTTLAAATANYYDYASSGIGANFITKESEFSHVTVACRPLAVSNTTATVTAVTYCLKSSAYSSTGPVGFGGIVFVETAVSKYPSMYADSNVLDFLVCFKIAKYSLVTTIGGASTLTPVESGSDWITVEEGCTTAGSCVPWNSPSLINGYVISGAVDIDSLKTSVVMGYLDSGFTISGTTTATIKSFIPAYLRLGFKISSPVGAAASVGFFLAGTGAPAANSLYAGLATYASSTDGSLNIIDMSSTTATTTTGTVMKGSGNTYDSSNIDLWFVHHCLLVSQSVASGSATTFSYYVPIQVNFQSIESLHVAFLSAKSNGQYPVTAVYRVFGSVFINNVISASSFATPGGAFYHLVATITTAYATLANFTTSASNTFQVASAAHLVWDAVSEGSSPLGTGCFKLTATTTTAPKLTAASSSLPFKPYKVMSSLTITTDVQDSTQTNCLLPTAAGTTSAGGTSLKDTSTYNFGSAFIAYIRDTTNLFASNTITWGYANSGTNKCVFHTVPSSSDTVTFSIYTIFCQADGYGTTAMGSASNTISFGSAFTTPCYWGSNYPIYNKLNYGWSSKTGRWTAFNGDFNSITTTTNWNYYTDTTKCVANDQLTLAQTSNDAPITLSLTTTNGVVYTLNANDYLTLTYSSLGVTLYTAECTHSGGLTCAISGSVITLTNGKTSAVTVSGTISVGAWFDSTAATTTAATYTVALAINGYQTEACSASTTGGIEIAGSQLSNVVTFSAFSFMNNQGARGVWSFSFSYSRIIRSGYYFTLNIGALAGPTISSANSNYHCKVLQNGAVSNSWSTITPIDTTAYTTTLTPKVAYSSGGTFTLQCVGGKSPDGSVAFSSNKASGVLKRSSGTQVTASTIPDANYYTVTTPSAAATTITIISLVKIFNTRGFDSDYNISFIPAVTTIPTTGIIIVEFSKSIAPKLNSFGIPECYLNETRASCKFSTENSGDERRLIISPTVTLLPSANQTYPYVLRIAGVTQPNGFSASTIDNDEDKKIFFALSTGTSAYSGISEMAYIAESWDASSTSSTIASLLIHDVTISSTKFRSTATYTYVINFPASSFITEDTILWVQFPSSLNRIFFYGNSPSFSFVRVGDSSSTSLVKRSSISRGRRVAVFLKADSTNTVSLNYTLTISNVKTPEEIADSSFQRDDFTIFLSSDNVTITASTASGARNSTNYVSWSTGTYTDANTLHWYDASQSALSGPVQVTLGTYKALVFLSASLNKFTSTFAFTTNGGATSAFSVKPKDPAYSIRAALGSTAAPVYLAAATSTVPTLYYLSWTGQDSTYSPIPNLDLVVVPQNCTPSLLGTTFNVPFGGGTSDPIIIDFSSCIPAVDVSVTANVSSGFNLTDALGISFAGIQTQKQTLTFTDMNGVYRLAFYATSNANLNGTATAGAATITFTMSGTNGANINSPGSVTINLVDANTAVPVPLTPTVTSTSTATTLSVGCDLTGLNFFAYATDTNAAQYSKSYITNQTQSHQISLTTPDSNDPTYAVFGYVSGLSASTLSTVDLTGNVKSGATMTVYSYCYSNSLVPSATAASTSWVQYDNGGKSYALQGSFNSALTSAQKVAMACALVKKLTISSKFVITDDNKRCTTLRLLETTTTTSNTTTSNTSNTSNSSSSSSGSTYSAIWYVQKDYLAESDTTGTTLASYVTSSTFLTGLITSIADSTFPTPASTLFTAIAVSTSSSNSSVPVVNYESSVVDSSSINVTFTLTNLDGVVYAGAEPNTVNASAPNATTLIGGYNGAGVQLTAVNYTPIATGKSAVVSLTGLNQSTSYTVYYVANNYDITINGLFSNVTSMNISTYTPSTTFGNSLTISMMLVVLALLALFGFA